MAGRTHHYFPRLADIDLVVTVLTDCTSAAGVHQCTCDTESKLRAAIDVLSPAWGAIASKVDLRVDAVPLHTSTGAALLRAKQEGALSLT